MTTILESTTAGIAYLRGGALVRCNRRFEAMLRLPPSAVAGSSLAELLSRHPDAENAAAEIREALIAGRIYETEFAFDGIEAGSSSGDLDDGSGVRRPGLRWYSLSVRRAGGATGFDEAIAVLSDVTRLKSQQVQLEALALERELMAERTRSILDSVLVGIVTVGSRGIEWMNRSARRMFGGELADFIGEPMAIVATAEAEHPFRRTDYLDELVEGQAETFECRVRARDGREFWVVGNAVATGRAATGRQLTFALLDIERRRQAEAAMSAAQASLRRVIEAAPLAIALLDARTLRDRPGQRRRRARRCGSTPERAARQDAGADLRRPTSPPRGGATSSSALAASDVTTREYRLARRRQRARLGRAPACRSSPRRRGARPAAAGRHRRDRAARRRRRRASRRRSRSARCWCGKCTTASRTTCRASPACCSRSPSASPRSPAAIDEVVGQVQAIAQVYGLQVGSDGPLLDRQRARGDHRLGAAHLRPADPLPRRRPRRRRLEPARGRGDPDRADAQRAAHQRHQAQRERRGATARSAASSIATTTASASRSRTAPACRPASAWRGSRTASPASAWCARCCRGRARACRSSRAPTTSSPP